jgi:DNA-binding Xre family transcriptional regulator
MVVLGMIFEIICLKHCIMLQLNLRKLAKERHIDKLYTYLVSIGFTEKIASEWARGKPKKLDLEYVELVCNRMKCEPNDILEWIPNEEEKKYIDKHPLRGLLKKQEVVDVKYVIRMLPKDELDELLAEIKKRQDKLLGPNVKFMGKDFKEDLKRPRRRRDHGQ